MGWGAVGETGGSAAVASAVSASCAPAVGRMGRWHAPSLCARPCICMTCACHFVDAMLSASRSSSGSSSSSTACPRSSPASRSPQSAATSQPTPPQATAACPTAQPAPPTGSQVRLGAGRSKAAARAVLGDAECVSGQPSWQQAALQSFALTLAPAHPHLQARRRRARLRRMAAAISPSPLWRPSAAPAPRAARGTTQSSRSTPRWVPVGGGGHGQAGRWSKQTGGLAAALARTSALLR